ncbi:MAG TPA: vitamin K epoxide reductase family protein [Acidimicrobiales bacterium]|nr:vitamin K epoxide reductase family protein [Acidimicrobiales bacterium]
MATRAAKVGGRSKAAPKVQEPDVDGEYAPRARPYLVPPGWAPVTTTILCLIALADSAYLTWIHYTNPTGLACSTKGFINCTAVTTSIYSHPFGVPVAVAGLIWSAGMLVLCSPWAWRAVSPWFSRLRLAGSVAGVGMVFYLLYVELFELGHLCEYCTVVHVMTVALFIVIALGTALAVPGDEDEGEELAVAG